MNRCGLCRCQDENDCKSAWAQFEHDTKVFKEKMYAKRPMIEDYANHDAYASAMMGWSMSLSMDRPNEPGYYRANND
jgi:hypothetical protein